MSGTFSDLKRFLTPFPLRNGHLVMVGVSRRSLRLKESPRQTTRSAAGLCERRRWNSNNRPSRGQTAAAPWTASFILNVPFCPLLPFIHYGDIQLWCRALLVVTG